uniref:NADH oxidase n=1 Tax=Panagrolaimus sp. JU765 TaxID=591449 RepID=A0AC34QMW0_9BILA
MSEYIAKFDKDDLKTSGIPTQTFVNFFEKWAAGGFGLISTGMILLDENGRGMFPGNLIIGPNEDSDERHSDERREAFSKIPKAVKPFGSVIVGQLGNIADVYRYFALEDVNNDKEVAEALKDGIYAAKFLNDCGFDGASVSVFPGDFDKNKKLIKDLITFIRNEVKNPNFVVGIKLNTARLQQAGTTVEETFKIIDAINNAGYDFIEIGGGSYEFPISTAADREDRYREIIHGAKKYATKTIVYIGGGIRRAKIMEKLVVDGIVDGICMARPVSAEFDIAAKIVGNHVPSTLVLPFEDDIMGGVLAAASQMNQAGQKSYTESNRDVNDGIMNLNDPTTLERFNEAKADFSAKLEAAKTEGKVLTGVIILK